jgi:small multidrug resistance family-3 protein
MTIPRSAALFLLAGRSPRSAGRGSIWQGLREHRGALFIGAGIVALGTYGFVATFRLEAHFGRILAANGGVLVARSLVGGMAVDGFHPDRFDILGELLCCLLGVAIIMYAPR